MGRKPKEERTENRTEQRIDNTCLYVDDISIYENRLFQLANEYITSNNLTDETIPKHFKAMIIYISSLLCISDESLSYEYIMELFNAFINLCDIYNYIPSIGLFYRLIDKKRNDIKDRLMNKYSLFMNICNEICKDRIIDYLSNNQSNSRNMIFIASSLYGMSETAPKKAIDYSENVSNRQLLDNLKAVKAIESEL